MMMMMFLTLQSAVHLYEAPHGLQTSRSYACCRRLEAVVYYHTYTYKHVYTCTFTLYRYMIPQRKEPSFAHSLHDMIHAHVCILTCVAYISNNTPFLSILHMILLLLFWSCFVAYKSKRACAHTCSWIQGDFVTNMYTHTYAPCAALLLTSSVHLSMPPETSACMCI